jgi:cell division protein FtsQ
MSVHLDTTDRFFRPADVENIRRNYRGVRIRSFLRVIRNAAIFIALVAAAVATYRHTQSNARFAIQHVEVTGAVHTAKASVESLTAQYRGLNLFKLDIDRVRRDLTQLAWVSRVEIEKSLPDTLRIRIVERVPVALLARDGALRYVDAAGNAFAELTPAVGDSDLPIIVAASRADTERAVTLIRDLREGDSAVYQRISEVRPLLPHGFALFDRELGMTVYAADGDFSAKWRDLYAIAAAENFRRGDVEYADLRFNGRIVLKPARVSSLTPGYPTQDIPTEITN